MSADQLTALTNSINTRHRQMTLVVGESVEAIWAIGALLAEVKDQLPPGEFINWIDTKCEFDVWTAQRCLDVAHRLQQPIPPLTLEEALEFLSESNTASPDSGPPPSEVTSGHATPRVPLPKRSLDLRIFVGDWLALLRLMSAPQRLRSRRSLIDLRDCINEVLNTTEVR